MQSVLDFRCRPVFKIYYDHADQSGQDEQKGHIFRLSGADTRDFYVWIGTDLFDKKPFDPVKENIKEKDHSWYINALAQAPKNPENDK